MDLVISFLLRGSAAGPIEILADHFEEFVVKGSEEVSESFEGVFVDVGVLSPFGLPQAFERLGVIGALQAVEPLRGVELKILLGNHAAQSWREIEEGKFQVI